MIGPVARAKDLSVPVVVAWGDARPVGALDPVANVARKHSIRAPRRGAERRARNRRRLQIVDERLGRSLRQGDSAPTDGGEQRGTGGELNRLEPSRRKTAGSHFENCSSRAFFVAPVVTRITP